MLCLLTGAALFSATTVRAAMPAVVMNEMMWMGSSSSSSDEWIELANTTDSPIDISSWSLKKLSSGVTSTMITITAGTIPARGFFVIANDPATNSRLAAEPNLVDSNMSLVNSRLQITLYDNAGTLIDTADDGSGSPMGGEYVSGTTWKSMERNVSGTDGTLQESWHTASVSTGFDDALKEFGTPGTANSNAQPVIVLDAPDDGAVGATLQFDASESSDPERDSLTYSWSFGDGTTADGATVSKVFTNSGTFIITLSVSDETHTVIQTHSISITVVPPVTPSKAGSDSGTAQTPPAGNSSSTTGSVPANSGTTPSTSTTGTSSVILSELFPNPKGDDTQAEFVELENIENTAVSLEGWELHVGSSKFVLSVKSGTGTVPAHGFLVLARSQTKLALPNSGTVRVELQNASHVVVDQTEYAAPIPEGQSWNRVGTSWTWSTHVTSGAKNVGDKKNVLANNNGTFRITELFPDPTGDDTNKEFIEIQNAGNAQTNLRGWSLTDTRTSYVIADDIVLDPQEAYAFSRKITGIALNNVSGTVYLLRPNATIVHGIRYAGTENGKSYSVEQSGKWAWGKPTPFDTNEEESTGTQKSSSAGTTISGIVVAELNTVLTNGFVVKTNSGNVFVTAANISLPQIGLGTTVQVYGKISHRTGETFLTPQTDDDITVLADGDVPEPVQFASGLAYGTLTSLAGTISDKRGKTFSVKNDMGTYRISIPSSITELPTLANGTTVHLTGIWRAGTSGARLMPRTSDDVVLPKVEGATTDAPKEPTAVPQVEQPNRSRTLAIGSVVGFLALAGAGIIVRKRFGT